MRLYDGAVAFAISLSCLKFQKLLLNVSRIQESSIALGRWRHLFSVSPDSLMHAQCRQLSIDPLGANAVGAKELDVRSGNFEIAQFAGLEDCVC